MVSRLPICVYAQRQIGNPVKVTIQRADSKKMSIQIEGKLAGRHVAELDRIWQEVALTLGETKLSLDIRGVTYLDKKGGYLLAGIFANTQAEFIADTPLTKYFAEQAQRSVHREQNGKNLETYSQPKVRKQL